MMYANMPCWAALLRVRLWIHAQIAPSLAPQLAPHLHLERGRVSGKQDGAVTGNHIG